MAWFMMKYNPDVHRRKSIRLKDYDYSQAGAYFITICIHKKECVLGEVADDGMKLSRFGEVVKTEWLKTFEIRKNLILDEYIVMSNHFHGIIIVDGRGTLQRAPTFEKFGRPISNSVPTVVRLFKSATTNQVNQSRNTPRRPFWQRNYFEHIIRNEDELNKIREYIQNNPLKWHLDRENPGRVAGYELEDEIFRHFKKV
jgi:REP element-mobilizing transposase RayT